ncbi:PH domain-containing protein [Halobacillus litoralis]|uniref:PH domain-containing protein n=1 Tax=Halobacillus litoralis TaxID=45668 RepID=A0A845F971_9BACI|nr:PH domain-containing protein [Halobacillus litoralis]MYL70401.1 PH domain-containing protein [Halobacillus litoralis]
MNRKRNHPMMMVYELGKLIKNSLFLFIFFFVVKAGSETWFFVYGRYGVVVLFMLTVLYLPFKWYSRTYQLDDKAVHMASRLFTTTQKTVPYSKIQNVQKELKWFHRVFGMTSLTLETSMQGGESSIRFPVLKKEEAARIEQRVQGKVPPELKQQKETSEEVDVPILKERKKGTESECNPIDSHKRIHFTPKKRELFKASFASLSFLALTPVIGSFLSKLDDFHFEKQVDGFLSFLFESTTVLVTTILLFVILSAVFGIGSTILKYGKYEIASDKDTIYITKGMVEEKYVSISKGKVQAVLVEQSLMKRILGLAMVKFVTAGGSGEESEVTALYPYLPVSRASSLIEELLADYRISSRMNRLPKQAAWIRMLKPSWLWLVSTVLIFFVKPEPLGISQAWWIFSIVLFILIMISRVLSYYHSSYAIHDQYIQFRSGGFTTSLYLSKRSRIIEMEASQTFIQKKVGLASLNIVNQANPVRFTSMEDLPAQFAGEAYQWYTGRKEEVHLVTEGEENHEQMGLGVLGDGYH